MGTIAPMIIQPWGAVLIGFVGGAISTTSFKYIQVHICNVTLLIGLLVILVVNVQSVTRSLLVANNVYKVNKYYNPSLCLIKPTTFSRLKDCIIKKTLPIILGNMYIVSSQYIFHFLNLFAEIGY